MSATSIDLSQIKTDALSAASTFRTLIGLGTSDTPTFKAATLSAGTLNGTVLDIAQTWGGTGTYTGIKYNVTDSGPANAASLLLDLQVGGSSRFSIDKTGLIAATGPVRVTNNGEGFTINVSGQNPVGIGRNSLVGGVDLYGAGVSTSSSANVSASGLKLPSASVLSWSVSNVTQNSDLVIARDAAGILAQRRTFDTVHYAQAYRIYNKYTDTNNYERGVLDWQTTSDVLRIGTEAAGAGMVARNIALVGGNVGIGTTSPGSKLTVAGSIEIGAASGSGVSPLLFNPNNIANYSLASYYPSSGTNVQCSFNVIPKGTGQSNNKSQINIFGTDFVADSTNYEFGCFRATGNSFTLSTGNSGTGTLRQLILSSGLASSTPTNTTQLVLDTTGNVGISNNSPAAKLDILDTTGAGSGSLAASILNLAQTWNTTGTPTAFKLNVTDTASNAASLFAAFQFAGVSRYEFAKTAFRLYNTNDASTANYERAKIAWSSNVLQIGTEKLGTGAARALELQTDGTTRLTIGGANGNVTVNLPANETWFSLQYAASEYVKLGLVNGGYGIGGGSVYTSPGSITFGSGAASIRANAVDVGTSSASFTIFNQQNNTTPHLTIKTVGYTTKPSFAIESTAAQTADSIQVFSDGGTTKTFWVTPSGAATFKGNVTVSAVNLVTDTTTGTKIGTATTQKLGFYNATPVVQPAAVADATDAASVITQLNLLLARMRDLGLIAT